MHTPTALEKPDGGYDEVTLAFPREDIKRINAEIAERVRTQGAVRIQIAYFRCPWPCSREILDKTSKKAITKWIRYMEQTGWRLVSRVKMRPDKRQRAHALQSDWFSVPVLDEVEIPVAAAFEKRDMQFQRIEVPVRD